MLRIFTVALLVLSAAQGSAAATTTRPEVADNVHAWSGEQGIQVWTLRYGHPDEHKALVQITQIDHAWKNKIQLMDVDKKGKRRDYSVMVDGKKYVALIITGNNRGELYLPGEAESYNVCFNKELSEEGNAQFFLTDYLQQENRQ